MFYIARKYSSVFYLYINLFIFAKVLSNKDNIFFISGTLILYILSCRIYVDFFPNLLQQNFLLSQQRQGNSFISNMTSHIYITLDELFYWIHANSYNQNMKINYLKLKVFYFIKI